MKRNAYIVFLEELLRVVVAVNVDLGKSVENRWVLATSLHPSLKPRQDQLQSVPVLHFTNELIDREVTRDGGQERLDAGLVAVNVQESSNDLRRSDRVDTLDVDLDEVKQTVLVEIKNKVVDEVETVANDDKRKLIGKLGLLEEVLDLLRVVEVTFSADSLNLPDLACAGGRLDVLEVHLRILTEVDDGAEIVV